eukprot:g15681.t1
MDRRAQKCVEKDDYAQLRVLPWPRTANEGVRDCDPTSFLQEKQWPKRGHAPTGSGPPAHPWDPKRDLPTRGLLNLGNTCFFNSALQNVFKARLLHEALFADGSGRREGEYMGPLTKAFRKVLLEMTGEGPVGGRRGPYSPKALLSAVQRAHPSFRGFHQQDAHELFMRLVGTLEDEEDSCIKKRRQEEEEAQDARREEEGVNGSAGSTSNEGGEVSPADSTTGGTLVSTPESQSPEEDGKTCAGDDEGACGAHGENDGALATPGVEKEGPDVLASERLTRRPSSLAGLSVPKAISVLVPASGDKQETSDSSNGAASTNPLCDRGEAELSTTGGETCERNGSPKGHAVDGKSSDDAGTEPAEAAGAGGEDEEVVVVKTDYVPTGISSANEKGMVKNDSMRCSRGGGGVNADADSTTDDGETTDAGDHDDDDDDDEGDDDMDGAAFSSPSRSPPGPSAEPAESDSAGVGAPKEKETDGNEEIVAAVAPVVPQRAAVTEVFGGTMCSVVTCSSCGGRSFCTEPTICLSLEIPMKPKALSKAALAFIAKKKAAAAAKAAAASAEAVDPESGKTTTDGTSTAAGQPSPSPLADKADESVTEPALGEEKADELEGFQLSAKEKRKVARQEREKQREKERLMKAKAKEDEEASGDAAGCPGPESNGSRPPTAKSPKIGAGGDAQTSPDGNEVRQCLEHIVSACAAAAGADGVGEGVAGLGFEAVAVEEETNASAVEHSETEGTAPEALSPGFELPARERKKIARQAILERQRSMGQDAATEGEDTDAPQTSPDECNEPIPGGGGRAGASEPSSPCATVRLEPENGAARSSSETAAQQSAEKPSDGEDEGQSTAVDDSGKCDGGGGGADSIDEKDDSASNVATVTRDPASPVAKTSPASFSTGLDHGQTQQPTARAADEFERPECDGRRCGDGPPTPEAVDARAETSGQSGQAEAIDAVAQNDGLRDRIEISNDPDGVGTLSSSGSLAGCTTGEAQRSTDLQGSLGSAFGSEWSESNNNGEKSDDSATSTDPAVDSSNEPGTEVNKDPGGRAPVIGSTPTDLEASMGVGEGEADGSKQGQGSPLPNGSMLAADENDDVMRTAGGNERSGEPPAAEREEEATAIAPSTASQSPLNRLEEPPARAKPDRRHDADGIDLYGCLDHFMAEEQLVAADGNGYDCEGCNSRARPSTDEENDGDGAGAKTASSRRQQNAKKRLLMLGQPPGVLVCHLKRLQAKRKIIRSVEFPIELDMAPYFWRDPKAPLTPKQTCYRLTGLIQHRGSRLGGHYVAYVRDNDGWKHASDSAIRTATLPELKACEAYMLFYERMGSVDAEGDESGVAVGVSGNASGCSDGDGDGDAAVKETSGDPGASESGGAVLSTGSTTAADAEAVEGEHGGKRYKGEDGASAAGQREGEGQGVTSGATEPQEDKGETDAAAQGGGGDGATEREIWI